MSFDKFKYYRDKNLMDLARDQECLLQVDNFCRGEGDTSSTVACHENSQSRGKGMGIKSSHAFTVWGCHECHKWLDQGSASKKEKEIVFQNAFERQLQEWQKIADNVCLKPWKVQSARNVLQYLKEHHG